MVRKQRDRVSEGVCSAHVPLQASLLPERLSGPAGVGVPGCWSVVVTAACSFPVHSLPGDSSS